MLAVLLMEAATGIGPVGAEPRYRGPPRVAQAVAPGDKRDADRSAEVTISPARAAEIAASRTGGRVLDVQLQGGKRPRYRVRVLLGGERVRTVTVDAVTGEFRG